ncbi:hypothetical protein [Parafrankia sp. FMc2]|uniref:hypothetical protein n=1 Tax=Parafrankia sp. FMc2 TaxID=3233196 RepID=UPI0034D5A91C
MASVKRAPSRKRKPLSTWDLNDPRYWIVGGWRLGLGSVRVSVAGRDRWRTWGDIATPGAGAGSLYLLSTLGADPLGPLGPTIFESGLLDVTDPYRLTAAALGGTAALLHQRSDAARGHRERRAVLNAFAELGAGEGPTLLHPSGRPVQVKLPEPTKAGARFVMKIPDGVTEVEMLSAAQRLSPMLKGRVSMRPTVAPATGRKAIAALASGAAAKTVTVARKSRTDAAPTEKAKRSPLEELLTCSHIEVNIRRRETLNKNVPWEGLAEIRRAGKDYKGRPVQTAWHVGQDEDGNPVYDTIFARNKLSGGEAGSGKSTGTHVDICAVSQDANSRNFFIDPSGGAELGFWEPLAAKTARGGKGFAYTVDDAVRLLRELHAEGVAALQRMADTADEREAAGLPRTNVAPGEITTWIWIDELLSLTKHPDKDIRGEVAFLLFDIIGRLRKVGYHIVCSTLKPTGDVIPTFVRDLITIKQVFRCTTADGSTSVLGDKIWAALGYGGHKIEMKSPKGISYLLGAEGYPVRLRCAFVDPDVQPGQIISERHEVLNAALRLRGLPEVPPLVKNVDPARAALLDPSRPPRVPAQRESVTLTPPPSSGKVVSPAHTPTAATPADPTPAPSPAPLEVVKVAETEEIDSLAEVLREAARIAVEAGQLSPRMLQGPLGLDFDAAAWVLGELEERKVIAPAEGNAPTRTVLATADNLDRLLADEDVPDVEPETTPAPADTARAGYAQRKHRPDKRTRARLHAQREHAASTSKEG